MEKFPEDADGDVLRKLQSQGVNLSVPRRIDFYCYAKDLETARQAEGRLRGLGYESEVFDNEDPNPSERRISIYTTVTMVPSYLLIIAAQKAIDAILSEYGTQCDGWGTLVDPPS